MAPLAHFNLGLPGIREAVPFLLNRETLLEAIRAVGAVYLSGDPRRTRPHPTATRSSMIAKAELDRLLAAARALLAGLPA